MQAWMVAGLSGALSGAVVGAGAEALAARRGADPPAWSRSVTAGALFVGLTATAAVATGGIEAARESVETGRAALALWLLAAAAIVDARCTRIPNEVAVAGAVAGLALNAIAAPDLLTGLRPPVGAGVVAGGSLLAIRIGSRLVTGRAGFGMGDVKLAAALGLITGWPALWTLYLGVVSGAVAGGAAVAAGRLQRTDRLPFAPCIAAGLVLHWVVVPLDTVLHWIG